MEVHSYTHTSRKKWTHYLCEFLMLFLAVFYGFLAEKKQKAPTQKGLAKYGQTGVQSAVKSAHIRNIEYFV